MYGPHFIVCFKSRHITKFPDNKDLGGLNADLSCYWRIGRPGCAHFDGHCGF